MRALPALMLLLFLTGCPPGYGSPWSPVDLYDDDDTPPLDLGDACDGVTPEGDPALAAGDPNAPEICNGVDDDCDGLVDELDPDLTDGMEVHPDADGDTYGDPDITLVVCALGAGQTEDDQDCDDTDPDVNPDAVETWDTTDANCDGDPEPDPCESTPTGTDVDADATCEVTPSLGWFNPGITWTLDEVPLAEELFSGSTATPLVGHLLDDDGDGIIAGPNDVPEVAMIVGQSLPYIAIITGDGSFLTTLPWPPDDDEAIEPNYQADLALGDVDGDGVPEIVATYAHKVYTDDPLQPWYDTCRIGVQEVDGTMLWYRDDLDFGCGHHAPALADLEPDGSVEIIYGDHVFDGATGATVWVGGASQALDPEYVNSGFHSFAVDLDGDGASEVVAGGTVYTSEGAVQCALGADGYPAVANLDADPQLEIVVTGQELLRVFDHDCTEDVSRAIVDGGPGGPAVIADFDGDGALEIGVSGFITYTVYEADGTPLWSQAITDISSGSTSSVAFDFDGDGAWEVVYGDENELWVFDGATGDPRVQNPWRASGTRNEQPVVADIDGDGSAEILVSNDDGGPSLVVLADSLDRWAGARPVWNQHAFHPSAVSDDLTVGAIAPAGPDGFRITTPIGGTNDTVSQPEPAANLEVVVWGTCEPLPGSATYWWQVVNTGSAAAPAETRMYIELQEDFGGRQLMFDEALGEPLEPGDEHLIFSGAVIDPTLGEYDSIFFFVDSEDLVAECDEGDNTHLLWLPDS